MIVGRSISAIIFLFLMLRCIYGQTESVSYILPDPAECCEGPLIISELIFSPENSPTAQCHASTIEETDNGFIAAWFGGTHEGHKDVGIWISINTRGKWSQPVEVVNGIQVNGLRYPCWNPVFFKPVSGPLMLFYKLGPGPQKWWGMLVTSDDDGLTWSEPRELGYGIHGKLIGPAKNKPVQLEDGTIICPASIEYQDESGDLFWRVFFEIYDNGGNILKVTEYINDGIQYDAIQPCILTHPGNSLQALCRSRQNVITHSWSYDSGLTWSNMTATILPNPDSGIDALTLADGRHILAYNHTTSKSGFPEGRNMLNIAVSENGINWKPVMTLERQEGEYSYPAIIQSSDGLLHVTYTYQRRSIKHLVIDPDSL